jgi:hypothetical protein
LFSRRFIFYQTLYKGNLLTGKNIAVFAVALCVFAAGFFALDLTLQKWQGLVLFP